MQQNRTLIKLTQSYSACLRGQSAEPTHIDSAKIVNINDSGDSTHAGRQYSDDVVS